MTQQRDERGATAVIVSIMLVVLVGFGALSVDVGSLWWDKKQLQNGADAAALALAQSCAEGACEFDEPSMADIYATGNKLDSNVAVTGIAHTANSVKVDVKTTREHWLAPVLGLASSSDVPASATASWGGIGAAKVLPLTISMCDKVNDYTEGTEIEIVVRDKKTEEEICLGSAGHYAPGNWGWLAPTSPGCVVETKAGGIAGGDPGTVHPSGCESKLTDLHLEESILMPVFDGVTGSGANTEFTIVGFISLKVSAYCVSHNKAGMKGNVNPPATPECKNANDRWIRGTFVRYVDIGAEMGGPDYGSTTVKLTD